MDYQKKIFIHFLSTLLIVFFPGLSWTKYVIVELDESAQEFDWMEYGEAMEIERLLLKEKKDDWRSHMRLIKIADLLHENDEEAKALIRKQHCPTDCRQKGCPLEVLIAEKLKWRIL